MGVPLQLCTNEEQLGTSRCGHFYAAGRRFTDLSAAEDFGHSLPRLDIGHVCRVMRHLGTGGLSLCHKAAAAFRVAIRHVSYATVRALCRCVYPDVYGITCVCCLKRAVVGNAHGAW